MTNLQCLNATVIKCAAKLNPEGYDTREDAPSSFEALCEYKRRYGRICVWTGASDHTIFGYKDINWAFRAWHDAHHWLGQHPFTREGEQAVMLRQQRDILALWGDTARGHELCQIIHAEIIGQRDHEDRWGGFPDNQLGFVMAYLDNPHKALERIW
jgi:hypothetical protein